MTQLIKYDDLVYLPSVSNRLYKVGIIDNELVVFHQDLVFKISVGGCLFKTGTRICLPQQFAFLATPENKEKLEQVYGKLEDIPVDEEVEQFSKALDELSAFYAKLDSSNGDFRPSDKLEELKSIKVKLIEMFKERGKK